MEANKIILANGSEIALEDATARSFLEISDNKNGIFRGKNLGTFASATEFEQFVSDHKISTGVFDDLYLGDYFIIKDGTYNAQWMIAGFNTEYNKGDTAVTKQTISLVNRTTITSAKMNESNTTEGGYKGSAMNTTTIPTIVEKIQTIFGDHLIQRRVLISNAVNTSAASMAGAGMTGASSGWEWSSQYATLLTEPQLYGTTVCSSSFYDVGEGCQQLPVYKFINHTRYSRTSLWLRAVASSSYFAYADGGGRANYYGASYSLGVRLLIIVG